MKRDLEYVRSMEAWFTDMDLNMQQTSLSLDFHTKEIELHKKHIDVLKAQLEHDYSRNKKSKEDFEKYLADTTE